MKQIKLTTAERLKDIINDSNKTAGKIAEEIGVSASLLSDMCNEEKQRKMNSDSLVKICRYFNVSADYLLGLTEIKTYNADIRSICDYTGFTSDYVSILHDSLVNDNVPKAMIISAISCLPQSVKAFQSILDYVFFDSKAKSSNAIFFNGDNLGFIDTPIIDVLKYNASYYFMRLLDAYKEELKKAKTRLPLEG